MAIRNKYFGSSAIASATWDDETGELTIEFEGGRGAGLYSFNAFPEHEWERFTTAHSPGSFFNVYIKGRYA